MRDGLKFSLVIIVLASAALYLKQIFDESTLAQTLSIGDKICKSIQVGMSVSELRDLSASYDGRFIVMSPSFGVASKRFCRCGVYLEKESVVSSNHSVWCLN